MIEITVRENGSPRQYAEVFPEIMEEAMAGAMHRWHEQIMPTHFTEEGFHKYHYQPRKGQNESNRVYLRDVNPSTKPRYANRLVPNKKYYWRKWREKGTHDPLVFTGNSFTAAKTAIKLSYRFVKSTGIARTTIALPRLPRYFYQYKPGTPNKWGELTTITADEYEELSAYMDAYFKTSFASLRFVTNDIVIR